MCFVQYRLSTKTSLGNLAFCLFLFFVFLIFQLPAERTSENYWIKGKGAEKGFFSISAECNLSQGQRMVCSFSFFLAEHY